MCFVEVTRKIHCCYILWEQNDIWETADRTIATFISSYNHRTYLYSKHEVKLFNESDAQGTVSMMSILQHNYAHYACGNIFPSVLL